MVAPADALKTPDFGRKISSEMRARVKRRERIRRITILVVAAVIAVSLIVGIYFALNNSSPYATFVGKPVSGSVLSELTGVSDGTLSAVAIPAGVSPPATISGSSLTLNGLPEVLYIGGDYCPYCAIERWSLIIALSRFGHFSNLTYMLSSSSDVNPSSPTFSFSGATYSSPHVSFVGVEEFGQDPNTVRQPLTSQQQDLVSAYDKCGSSGNSGGIPFIDIGNAYAVNCGAQSTLDISGENWTAIASQLNDPSTNVAKLVDGAANTLISAICKVTGQTSYPCNQTYATLGVSYAGGGSGATQTVASIPPRSRVEWSF